MPVDFTFAAFEALCQSLTAIPVFTVKSVLMSPPPHTRFVILRCDVDYRETHAVRLAAIAARYGLRGSFYFRHRGGSFALDVMHTVARHGHEIGYHFATLDTCQGDFDAAANLFAQHIAELRAAGCDIVTVAAHGSTPTAATYRSNRDLLIKKPDLLQETGIIGEASLSIDFAQVYYLSDATWRWQWYEHFSPGARGTTTTLRAQCDRLPHHDRGLYINIHPQQWFEHAAHMVIMRARNRLGKPLVPLLRHWHILKPDG